MKTTQHIQDILQQLNSEDFIQDLQNQGGEIFLVGGIVRDGFLEIESKDIDLLIRKLSIGDIIQSLRKFGNLTETTVADKMGIVKFRPTQTKLSTKFIEEDIDIALPRTEKLMNSIEMEMAGITNMHNAFHINSDPNISVEQDLERRDFTINSIAIKLDGTIVDPFGGLQDLENKIIRHTNTVAFSDDPLRMFRAVQFASRFEGFEIFRGTMEMIIDNSEDAKTIAPERIHTELLKIFNKGDIKKGIRILRDSKLLENFISFRPSGAVESIHTIADFFFHLFRTGENFQKILHGDTETRKGIDAIHAANSVMVKSDPFDATTATWDKGKIRLALFDAIQISPSVLDSKKLLPPLKLAQIEFKNGQFPKSMSELDISGKDFIDLGMTPGPMIGKLLRKCLELTLSEICKDKQEFIEMGKMMQTINIE